MATRTFDRQEHEHEYGRVLAFSDGVFAIAMTLLVITIDIPDISHQEVKSGLPQALERLLPEVFSYFLSFAVIGIYWIKHHLLFSRLQKLSSTVMVLNLSLLAFVALLPFPSALLGDYGDQPITVVIYAANICLIGLIETRIYRYAVTRRMLREAESPAMIRSSKLNDDFTVAVFALSIPIALLIGADAGVYSWVAVWLLRYPFNWLIDRRD